MAFRTFICWYGRPGETPPDEVMARYNLIVGRACPSERRAALRNLSPDIRFIVYRNAIDCRLAAGIEDIAPSPTGRRAPEHAECGYEDIPRARRDCLLKNRGALRNASRDPRTIYTWGYQQPYDATSRHANRFFLDPRSAWKDVYPELCAESVRAGGYDGVFCDNAGAHIEWIFEGLPDDLKPDIDDEQWARAMADLLTGVARRLTGEKPGALVFANTCGDFVSDDGEDISPTTFWSSARIHGAMDEFFAHAGPAGRSEAYLDELKWRRQIRAILCCEKLGRGYLAQSNGDEHDHDARVYSLASFLTGAGSRSAFNYNPAGGATYPLVYRFPEWDIDLGRPVRQYESVGEALAVGQGRAFAREFERGLALVNPGRAPAENVAIPASAERMVLEGGVLGHGGRVSWAAAEPPITLRPHTAQIFRFGR